MRCGGRGRGRAGWGGVGFLRGVCLVVVVVVVIFLFVTYEPFKTGSSGG